MFYSVHTLKGLIKLKVAGSGFLFWRLFQSETCLKWGLEAWSRTLLAATAAFWDQEVRSGSRNRFSYTTSAPWQPLVPLVGVPTRTRARGNSSGESDLCSDAWEKDTDAGQSQAEGMERLSQEEQYSWRLSLLELAGEETELRMLANPCELPKKMHVPTLPTIDSGSRCYSGSSTDRATWFIQLSTGRRKADIHFSLFEKSSQECHTHLSYWS